MPVTYVQVTAYSQEPGVGHAALRFGSRERGYERVGAAVFSSALRRIASRPVNRLENAVCVCYG